VVSKGYIETGAEKGEMDVQMAMPSAQTWLTTSGLGHPGQTGLGAAQGERLDGKSDLGT
jgi:hypothetical protein